MLVEFEGPSPFAVLVFRGAEQNTRDYLTYIGIWKLFLDRNELDVHAGFRKALDSVWDEIAMALARLKYPMFYTGHSMGAALATLAAARHAPGAVYTFGSPRVGNQAFIDTLCAVPIYRVVDDQDVIATVPSKALGFRHAGTELLLGAPSRGFSFDRLFYPPKFMADHAPINYVDRI